MTRTSRMWSSRIQFVCNEEYKRLILYLTDFKIVSLFTEAIFLIVVVALVSL